MGLSFEIVIGAKDTSQSAIRSALSGFAVLSKALTKPITIPISLGTKALGALGGAASKSLGVLQGLNLGLRPLISGMDNLIERGTQMDVVRKSFSELTGQSGPRAEAIAKSMQRAAAGTVRLSEAMAAANEGMAAGLSVNQIATAFEFVSRKAMSTGESVAGAMSSVMHGLKTGQMRAVDDFGLLAEGVDGVKAAFDKLHGEGAFGALKQSAQKAQIVNAVLADMRRQLGTLGVSGKETAFEWAGLKNTLGDTLDRLSLMVAKSPELQGAMRGVRDMAAGIADHLDKGGSLMDILIGKEGGKSGGLLGMLGSGIKSIGKAIGAQAVEWGGKLGQGFVAALEKWLKKLQALFEFNAAKKKLGDAFKGLAEGGGNVVGFLQKALGSAAPSSNRGMLMARAAGQVAVEAAGSSAAAAPGVITNQAIIAGGSEVSRRMANLALRNIAKEEAVLKSLSNPFLAKGGSVVMNASAAGAKTGIIGAAARGGLKFVATKLAPAATIADFFYSSYQLGKEIVGLREALKGQKEMEALAAEMDRRAAARKSASSRPAASQPFGRGMGMGWGFSLGGNGARSRGGGNGPLESARIGRRSRCVQQLHG